MGGVGSAKLDCTLACSVMFLCGVNDGKATDRSSDGGRSGSIPTGRTQAPEGVVWSQKQLASLVWALGHKNQDVLDYTASTV